MFHFSLDQILHLLTQYGYEIIFPISVLEGPIVAIISGFLVSLGKLNGVIVFLILIAGDITGDVFYYSIGRWSRGTFLFSLLRYIGITESRVEKAKSYFEKHDLKILIFGKTQPIGSVILVAAGLTHMPFGRFIFYNSLISAPKVLMFQLVGFYFGSGYKSINSYLNYAGIASLIIAALLILLYIFVRRYIRLKEDSFTK